MTLRATWAAVALARKTKAYGIAISGVYLSDLLRDPWNLDLRAGIVYGTLKMDGVP